MAKKNKYDDVLAHLQPLPTDLSPRQLEIEAIKQVIKRSADDPNASASPKELSIGYLGTRRGFGPPLTESEESDVINRLGVEGLERLLSEANKQLEAYEQLLESSHDGEEDGWGLYGAPANAVRLENGYTVSVQPEPVGKVVDKDRFRQWCIDNGLGNLLQLWPSTMQSIVKERLLNGQSNPDGVESFSRNKIVLRAPRF